ncbi:MAG TPA: metallopeptidase (SprT family) [Gammaproteobacteria bacterium]|nr:metallopeptidase (SprT family) [Gammaproteobacteria bacterium]
MSSLPILTDDQARRVVDATRERIRFASRALNQSFPELEIRFDVSGRAWGYYVRRGRQRSIRYNPWLFARFFTEGIDNTVPHEVAHFIVDCLHPRQRVKPHGPEWRRIMALFGIDNPSATHRADLGGLPIRRQRRFDYRCRCGVVPLTATRHYRYLRGEAVYHCRRCGQALEPVEG